MNVLMASVLSLVVDGCPSPGPVVSDPERLNLFTNVQIVYLLGYQVKSSQVYAEDYASGQSAFWTARQSLSANSIALSG